MGRIRRLPFARFAVLAIVLGGHVLFLLLLSSSRPRDDSSDSDPQERTVLLFLNLSIPEEEPEPEPQPEPQHDRVSTSRMRERAASDTSDEATSIHEDAPSTARGRVDWYSEAEVVAKDRGAELLVMQDKNCEHTQSDRPGSMLPKCGKKPKPPREWEPEPKRFGLEGLLPFVRINERCVIGLGFFGCALGKMPEPDGHLFDDMKDPDRPTSSVPDIPGKE
jgi:hypothetical protein